MPFWQILAIIGSNMAIGIGVSTLYGFLYLLPALMFFMTEHKAWDNGTKCVTILFALIFTICPPVHVIKSICTFILLIILLRASYLRIKKKKENERSLDCTPSK